MRATKRKKITSIVLLLFFSHYRLLISGWLSKNWAFFFLLVLSRSFYIPIECVSLRIKKVTRFLMSEWVRERHHLKWRHQWQQQHSMISFRFRKHLLIFLFMDFSFRYVKRIFLFIRPIEKKTYDYCNRND
jgi:hypothetical protein